MLELTPTELGLAAWKVQTGMHADDRLTELILMIQLLRDSIASWLGNRDSSVRPVSLPAPTATRLVTGSASDATSARFLRVRHATRDQPNELLRFSTCRAGRG